MSDAKHTPGPWAAEDSNPRNPGHRWSITAPTPKPDRRFTVAVTICHSNEPEEIAATAADVRLIALAPELLKFAEQCVLFLDCCKPGEFGVKICQHAECEQVREARHLIARATTP